MNIDINFVKRPLRKHRIRLDNICNKAVTHAFHPAESADRRALLQNRQRGCEEVWTLYAWVGNNELNFNYGVC